MTVEVWQPKPRSHRRNGKTANDRLAEAERMARDRAMGLSQIQLMEKYGVSRQTVIRRLKLAVEKALPASVEMLRDQQNAVIDLALTRLGHTLETAEELMRQGRTVEGHAMRDRALKTMGHYLDRRARLNGLDASTKVEGTITHVVQEDLDLAEVIREAKERARAREDAQPDPDRVGR